MRVRTKDPHLVRGSSSSRNAQPQDDLSLRIKALSRLHELAMRLAGTEEPQPALQAIVETVVDVHSADFGVLSLYDSECDCLSPGASVGFDASSLAVLQKMPTGLRTSPCGSAFSTRERVVVEDIATDPRFESLRDFAQSAGFRAVHSTPIATGAGKMLGVLSVQFKACREPSDCEMQLADLCARHAAEAIEIAASRRELRDLQERLRLATRVGKVGIWDWDIAANQVSWSDSLFAIHGVVPERFSATVEGFAELVHPDDRAMVLRTLQQSLDGNGSYEVEFRAVRPDGRIIWLFTNAVVLRERGQATRMFGATMDVTERKLAEESLRDSEQRFRMLASHAPVGIFQSSARGETLFVNECWSAMAGLPPEQSRLDGWKQALHPEDRDRVIADWNRAVAEGTASQAEFRFLRPDGGLTWVQGEALPLRNESGELAGYIGTAADITERKMAELALRESEQRFRHMADHAPVMIWVTEADGRCTFLGKTWYEFTGRSPETSLGFGWVEAVHPDDRAEAQRAYLAASRRHEPLRHEYRLRCKSGEYRWVIDAAAPRLGEDGSFLGYIGSLIDISEQKKNEAALRKSQAALVEADRRKDEFLALLAHELRNPLAPIRTGLEVMRLAGDDHSVIEEVRQMMNRQSQQLVRLIDDLLDVSRITRGMIELRQCRVELATIIDSAAESSRPLIEELGHQLEMTLPAQPVVLEADPARLAQVVSNLLNNAAKYMPAGGVIHLLAERRASEVTISVKDAGIGIPTDMLERVFDMFTQVDASLERSQGGLGIGLTLVKRLVEMHGGRVEARSEGPDRGSEFVVRLPVVLGLLGSQESSHPIASSARRRILVVDDNKNAANVLGMLLRAFGNEVRTAFDGLEAIAVAAEFRPDIALLDIGMPKLNGYDTARRMRNEPWGRHLILAAITGWGQEEDKRRTRDAGFDYHFVKPLEPASLQRFLAECEPRN